VLNVVSAVENVSELVILMPSKKIEGMEFKCHSGHLEVEVNGKNTQTDRFYSVLIV